MNNTDRQTQFPLDSRQQMLDKIYDVSTPEGLHELEEVAETYEARIFYSASIPGDYMEYITYAMAIIETGSQNAVLKHMDTSNRPPDIGKPFKSVTVSSKSHRSVTVSSTSHMTTLQVTKGDVEKKIKGLMRIMRTDRRRRISKTFASVISWGRQQWPHMANKLTQPNQP